jgi:prepilin-type N-terminal cleavage/methylation domain-containing protein
MPWVPERETAFWVGEPEPATWLVMHLAEVIQAALRRILHPSRNRRKVFPESCRSGNSDMRNRGFSIIELVVVIGIISILLSIASISFRNWNLKNNIERQTKEMYMEITEARQLALNTRQARTVTFSPNSLVFRRYSSEADLEAGTGVEVKTKRLPFAITRNTWADPSPDNPNITDSDILFTTRGVMNQPTPKSICIYSAVDPAFDALVIVQSRVAAGKLKSQGGACDPTNIDVK